MFSKIFSEKTMLKLKKVPLFVWYLIFGIMSMFTSLYGLKEIGTDYVEILTEMLPGLNVGRVLFLFYPMMFIMDIVIFEIIAYFAFNVISKRYVLNIPRNEFALKLRIMIIMSNLVIGIVSLVYFLLPQIIFISTAIVNTFVQTFVLGIFLYEICSHNIKNNKGHDAYMYIARLYLGIMLVFNILNIISLFTLENVPFIEYIASVIKIVIILIMSGIAYMQYTKLKNLPKDPPSDGGVTKEIDNTVFKDFGF